MTLDEALEIFTGVEQTVTIPSNDSETEMYFKAMRTRDPLIVWFSSVCQLHVEILSARYLADKESFEFVVIHSVANND